MRLTRSKACQMQSHLSSRPAPNRSRFRPSVRAAPTMPFADFCHAVKAGFPSFSRRRFRVNDTWQISRGKTRIFPRIDAGFTKCSPFADGGLGGHVPTGPGCITPHIRFLFIVPRFRLGLPPHPPRGDALALWLTFGSANTWCQDFHPTEFVPCTAHTTEFSERRSRPLQRPVRHRSQKGSTQLDDVR